MILIIMAGIIFIAATGGGPLQIVLFIAIVGKVWTNYTDRNRRGGWWK